jgi:phosphoglycerate dehydrogenase-like enzyme
MHSPLSQIACGRRFGSGGRERELTLREIEGYTSYMTLRVHLLQEYNGEFLANLKKELDGAIKVTCAEEVPVAADFDILVCGVPDEKSLTASPNLKVLVIPWSGLPRKTRELMRRYPAIPVYNLHHNAVPVAETAMTLLLTAAKDLIQIDGSLRRHDWGSRYDIHAMDLLAGKRVLIVGYGAIGREIAIRCLAFGMRVSALRRSVSPGGRTAPGDIRVFPVSHLKNMLPGADVLFLSLPLTDETKGMIGRTELSLLPDGAILINISRGRIADEEALYECLKTSRIRAGLDVWYRYPGSPESRACTPPSEYPFHELTNVVMTPHLGGHSDKTEVLRARELAHLLNLASRGEPLPNRVDVERGY